MNRKIVKSENRFELREPLRSFLTAMKKLFSADACALYLVAGEEMDELEKTKAFERRFPQPVTLGDKTISKDNVECYKVLKFIGVDDHALDDNGESRHLWNFTYKKRPNKYIVFHDFPDAPYIEGEGITGMTARRKQVTLCEGKDIEGHPARNLDNDTDRKIHLKCNRILAVPIIDNEVTVGVLRFDIYELPDRKEREFDIRDTSGSPVGDYVDFSKTGTKCDIYVTINEVCKQVVAISNRNSDLESYSKLFGGEKMLGPIKHIRPYLDQSKSDMNLELYNLVEHLFFVLQRHTYIGFNELLQRVMYFIKDLFDLLEIPDYYALIEVKLNDFKNHENLMLYDTEKYRDHFMHQFHVFILGYVAMNCVGFDQITRQINARLKNTAKFNNVSIDNDSLLRIWTLAAFFHDITYIFEEYETKMQHFISKHLNVNIPVDITWGDMLSNESVHVGYLQDITEFFESPLRKNSTNKIRFFRNCVQALQTNKDHGILSALLLVQVFKPHISDLIMTGAEQQSPRMVEIYLAALAISLHNECIFHSLKEGIGSEQISFESFPLEFLLMYCDTAQEWGRKKEIKKVRYEAPILKSVDIVVKGNKKVKFVCNLHYPTAVVPDDDTLRGYLKEKLYKFCSADHIFKISYSFDIGQEDCSFVFKAD